MGILLVGLNYRTTPVEIREKFHLSELDSLRLMQALTRPANGHAASAMLSECAVLSTCNRVEVYGICRDEKAAFDFVKQTLAQFGGMSQSDLTPYVYSLTESLAVRHLMKVASGLDSMVLGEPQILGQVSGAHENALQAGRISAVMDRLMSQAIHAGKRARTETAISRHSTSVSHTAVQLVEQSATHSEQPHIVVVGAGEMAEITLEALQHHGLKQIDVVNRSYQHARSLADKFDINAHEWSSLWERILLADAVIAATGAPHTIIHNADIISVMKKRDQRPLVLVDISLPRNIEESVADITGVTYYDIDDLHGVVDDSFAQREACIPKVEAIIREEVDYFNQWLNSRQAAPVISELREKVRSVAESELALALGKLDHLSDYEQKIITRMTHRIVNKILHEPTMCLRENAADQADEYLQLVRDLFALPQQHQHSFMNEVDERVHIDG